MESKFTDRLRFLVTNTKELANSLGVSIQAVNQFVGGKAAPKHENLIKIAKYYDVSVDYLLGLTDNPKPHLSISEYTGLSEKAINNIIEANKETNGILNRFFEELKK